MQPFKKESMINFSFFSEQAVKSAYRLYILSVWLLQPLEELSELAQRLPI
jgi:hypothetical protein